MDTIHSYIHNKDDHRFEYSAYFPHNDVGFWKKKSALNYVLMTILFNKFLDYIIAGYIPQCLAMSPDFYHVMILGIIWIQIKHGGVLMN